MHGMQIEEIKWMICVNSFLAIFQYVPEWSRGPTANKKVRN